MREEKKIKRSNRLCPCNPMDIEGIQTWLEDLALEGLILEQESVFCGFWSFEKTAPRRVQYRLEVIRTKFLEDSDCPRAEMVETAEAMGWEYVTRYRSFYIYRTFDPQARPLHTDPAVQALTVKALRRETLVNLVLDALYVLVMLFLRRTSFGLVFRDAATVGIVYTLCYLGLFAFFLIRPLTHVFYLQRAIKRLKAGCALDQKKPWKPKAAVWLAAKVIPVFLLIATIAGLLTGLKHAVDRHPVDVYTGSAPFVSIQELYPEGTVTNRTDMGDYNTYLHWDTALSENTEWSESGSITVEGESYHFILRLHIHETAAPWLAGGVFRDYYEDDFNRYHGKRFEDLEAPETTADDLRVYSSYGIRYILLRQGSTVIHGTVSITHGQETDLWQDWLLASVDKLTK